MPRTARLEELGLPHHVIIQGIERRTIFRDDEDRTRFVMRAIRVFREMGVEVLAWALVGNHAHFVLRATQGRLGKAMQRVAGPYAQSFNLRHDRVGRLFRDRFWSRPTEEGADDLLGLIGYVILNPLRAGLVGDLAELRSYPWTSLAELLSPPDQRTSFVDRTETLCLFGQDERLALEAILRMIEGQYGDDPAGLDFRRYEPGGAAALTQRERDDLGTASVHALRLRSGRIDKVLRERETSRARRLRLLRRGWTLDRVIARAARLCRVRERDLRLGCRRHPHSRARSLVAYFAGAYLGCTDAEIARATGVARRSIVRARARLGARRDEDDVAWWRFFEIRSGRRREPKRS